MGRRLHLTDWQRQKLHCFDYNSATVDIVTYDDLIDQAAHVYESLHHLKDG